MLRHAMPTRLVPHPAKRFGDRRRCGGSARAEGATQPIRADASFFSLDEFFSSGDRAGRARGHRLPEDIAQKLQALALTTEIEKTIRGAIPPSKLKRLERRIADRKGTGKESRKNKSSGGTREIDSLEEHSGYARSDMNVGDQDQGPKSKEPRRRGQRQGGGR